MPYGHLTHVETLETNITRLFDLAKPKMLIETTKPVWRNYLQFWCLQNGFWFQFLFFLAKPLSFLGRNWFRGFAKSNRTASMRSDKYLYFQLFMLVKSVFILFASIYIYVVFNWVINRNEKQLHPRLKPCDLPFAPRRSQSVRYLFSCRPRRGCNVHTLRLALCATAFTINAQSVLRRTQGGGQGTRQNPWPTRFSFRLPAKGAKWRHFGWTIPGSDFWFRAWVDCVEFLRAQVVSLVWVCGNIL